jgi:fucose permease
LKIRGLVTASGQPGLFSTMGAFFLIGISQSSTGPLLPLFERRFGASAGGVSLLITSYFLGALVAMILALSRALPARTMIIAGSITYILGCFGLFFLDDLPPSVACSALGGLGVGMITVNVNAIFAQQGQGVALVNLVNGFFALGTVVGPLLAAASIPLGQPYGFLVAGLGFLLCTRVIAVTEWPAVHATPADEGMEGPISGFTGFLALYLLYGGIESGIGSWAATHLGAQGFSASSAALAVSGFWAGTALSKFAVVTITRKVRAATLVAVGLAGTAVSLVIASLPIVHVLGYVLAGMCIGPVFPTGLAWIALRGGKRRITALASSFSMGGSIIFPAGIGWMVTAEGSGGIPIALSLLSLTGFLIVVLDLSGVGSA